MKPIPPASSTMCRCWPCRSRKPMPCCWAAWACSVSSRVARQAKTPDSLKSRSLGQVVVFLGGGAVAQRGAEDGQRLVHQRVADRQREQEADHVAVHAAR